MISIGNCGQDEILYMVPLLGAVHGAVSQRWRYALICMSVAVVFNPVMLLPCLLIIVSRSKKIIDIVLQTAVLFLPNILERMIFREHFPGLPTEAGAWSEGQYLNMFFKRALIPGGNASFSVFAIIFLLLFAAQLFNQYETEKQQQRFLLYSITCLMTTMSFFSGTNTYRLFLCIPFLVISVLLIEDEQRRAAGIAGLCVFEAFRVLYACCFYTYGLRLSDMHPYVQKILGVQEGDSANLYTLLKIWLPVLEGKELFVSSVVGACGVWLLWIAYPRFNQKISCCFSMRFMVSLYTFYPLMTLLLLCGLLTQTDITQVKIEGTGALAPALTGANCMEEYYRAVSDTNKANITVRTVTWNRNYPEDQALCMDIVDAETGAVVDSKQVLANHLEDNREYTFRFRNTKMKDGRWYIFRLYASGQIEAEEHYLYVLRSDEGTAKPEQHYAVIPENGRMIETNYDFTSQMVLY